MSTMSRDDDLLAEIVAAADRIGLYRERFGDSNEAFLADDAYQDACMMQLIHIAEQAKAFSDDFKRAHVEIPWSEIAGMRNILAHAYGHLDPQVAWETIEDDVPQLAQTCHVSLGKLSA